MSAPTIQAQLKQTLADTVQDAFQAQRSLKITGGGSKAFYGHAVTGTALPLADYQGIINYEPSELVITARAGTPLSQIEATLASQGQILGFEPPAFSPNATLGGTIACALSGPRRPYAGAARDFVLGTTMINGRGEILKFGGQVMKNVAGYDVSRLMCGAQGTLGALLEISLKVNPRPAYEETRILTCSQAQMRSLLSAPGRAALPVSATLLHNKQLYIRLSGARAGVKTAARLLGGDALEHEETFWGSIKEQQYYFFNQTTNKGKSQEQALWRLSLPPSAQSIPGDLFDDQLIEWGGALRWIYSHAEAENIQQWARANGGHATCFKRQQPAQALFSPLCPALLKLSQRIKHSFDPAHILNPGRLYPDL
ncbi:MAG: glycolate oxidase subunit GlcE [Pontibacterium sp.]